MSNRGKDFFDFINEQIEKGREDYDRDCKQLGDLMLDNGLLWIGSDLNTEKDGTMSFIATNGRRAQRVTIKISECEIPENSDG